MINNPLISIVIINFNGLTYLNDILIKNLESILNSDYKNFEILYIDNNSTDNSISHIKKYFGSHQKIQMIPLKENSGTAKAKNIGIRNSRGEFMLFMNNDIILEKNTISKMVLAMNTNPKIGIVGCKLVLPSRNVQTEGELFPGYTTKLLSFICSDTWRRKIIHNIRKHNRVDWVTGAAVLIKKEMLLSINGYDENYFMFCEDVDLAYRAKKAGYKVICIRDGRALHYYHQTAKHFSKWQLNISSRNELLLIFKNYSNCMFIKAISFYLISIFVLFFWSLIKFSVYNISRIIALIKAFNYIKKRAQLPN